MSYLANMMNNAQTGQPYQLPRGNAPQNQRPNPIQNNPNPIFQQGQEQGQNQFHQPIGFGGQRVQDWMQAHPNFGQNFPNFGQNFPGLGQHGGFQQGQWQARFPQHPPMGGIGTRRGWFDGDLGQPDNPNYRKPEAGWG